MIKKILFFLFSFSLLLITSFPSPEPAQAATCDDPAIARSVKDSEGGAPVEAHENDKSIYVEINPNGGIVEDVSILIKPPSIGEPQRLFKENRDEMATFRVDSNGKIVIPLIVLRNGFFKTGPRDDQSNSNLAFESGTYNIYVVPSGEQDSNRAHCVINFTVKTTPQGEDGFCSITLLPDNDYTLPGTKVGIKVKFNEVTWDPADRHHRVRIISRLGINDRNTPTTNQLQGETGWQIPDSLSAATYSIEVREHARSNFGESEGLSCETEWPFKIDTEANGGGYVCSSKTTGCDYKEVKPNDPLSQPCDSEISSDWSKEKGCLRIKTALGTIGTEAPEFVRWVLGFVLGISGGIVLIIIIITGYRLMTSQGDPEKVKNAKDALTAAIIGLLFIIFSLVILQFITADILQLPGFGG